MLMPSVPGPWLQKKLSGFCVRVSLRLWKKAKRVGCVLLWMFAFSFFEIHNGV